MDGFGSECSSGCESGWTMYLDSPNPSQMNGGLVGDEEYRAKKCIEEDEEEDLSMVSDASSGPPPHSCHESDEENGCYLTSASPALANNKSNINKRQKIKTSPKKQQQYHHSLLDDTASSPIFSFSKGNFHTATNRQPSRENVIDFSQGFCAAPFNELYAYRDHPDFLQSSMPAKSSSAKPVNCRKGSGNRIW